MYVATTNQNHLNPTLLMLRAGKNVLVEKPSAVTYQEAQLMYDEAEVIPIHLVHIILIYIGRVIQTMFVCLFCRNEGCF